MKTHEIATLPERIITVQPKVGVTSPPKPRIKIAPSTRVTLSKPVYPSWIWIGSITALIVMGPHLLRWFRSQRIMTRRTTNASSQHDVQRACKSNDPSRTRIALIAWAGHQWPTKSIVNLHDIPVSNEAFKKQLERLSSALYSQHSKTPWTGDELWRSISALTLNPLKQKNKKTKTNLPPIYPKDRE